MYRILQKKERVFLAGAFNLLSWDFEIATKWHVSLSIAHFVFFNFPRSCWQSCNCLKGWILKPEVHKVLLIIYSTHKVLWIEYKKTHNLNVSQFKCHEREGYEDSNKIWQNSHAHSFIENWLLAWKSYTWDKKCSLI